MDLAFAPKITQPRASEGAPADLAPLLRRIFWCVHTVQSWDTAQTSHTHAEASPNPRPKPLFTLAAAPFHDWSQVAKQIQDKLSPDTWNIERKESNGQAPRTLIFLSRQQHDYEIEILPLRGFKPAPFYYDYQRGQYLSCFVKALYKPTFLHINASGLYCHKKLVMTNPNDLNRFFGLNSSRPTPIYSAPEQFYKELLNSPFCHPQQLQPQNSPEPIPTGLNENPPLQTFISWCDANSALTAINETTIRLSECDIEERIHNINLGDPARDTPPRQPTRSTF
jgi:hypothetical protein